MAQNNKKIDIALSNAVDEILNNYEEAMSKAVNYAIAQTEKDYWQAANECLVNYYLEDRPDVYQRTEKLHNALLPYKDVKKNEKTNKISGVVGVQYDADALEASIGDPPMYMGRDGVPRIKHIGYYGSAKHQPVDAWWVLQNYLKGIHPDGTDEDYSDWPDQPNSPNATMTAYREDYVKTFDQNILMNLLMQINHKMK